MKLSRRQALASLSLPLALAGLGGVATPATARSYDSDGIRSGMVFTSSNAQAGNDLLVYARGQDGTLSLLAQVPTGGQGSGAGLGSQGAVTLSLDGRYLFVVNAGSNSVSTFELREGELQLASVTDSGGLHPISVTEYNGQVFVLNDAGAGNVAGFRNVKGTLSPLAGSVRGLSAAGGTAPAQVSFSTYGDTLLVTEKGTNRLTSYRVREDGGLSAALVTASPGLTPFGFAFNRLNRLLVTEAVGGAPGLSTVSSYRFNPSEPARSTVASASVANGQSASCWIAITPSGRYAYASNTGSANVSSYRVASDGRIELLSAVAGLTGAGSAPADSAISPDGRRLYVRNGRIFTISAFEIGDDGSLSAASGIGSLPGNAVGLAAN